jgi:hypothetical protein
MRLKAQVRNLAVFFTPGITLIQECDKFSSLSADRTQQHGRADRDQHRGLSLQVSYRRFRNETRVLQKNCTYTRSRASSESERVRGASTDP